MASNTSSRFFLRGMILTSIVSLVLLTVSATAAGITRNNFIASVQEFLGLSAPTLSKDLLPNQERQNSKMKPTLGVFETNAVEPMFFFAGDQTWDGGTSGGGTAWLTATNWVGDASFAGSQTATASTDIATIPSTTTNPSIGLNMNFAGNTFYLGAINFTATNARSIGNSSGIAGTLQLNGATVNAVPNVIIRNSNSAALTLQATQTGTMGVGLGNTTENVISVDGAGAVSIGSVISGAGKNLTVRGNGLNQLVLTGANTYSGTTVIKNGGVLALSAGGSIANSATIEIQGGGFFDANATTSALTLASGQGLKGSATTGTGTINTSSTHPLTTAANSPLSFTAYNGTNAQLTVGGNGTLSLQSGNVVTVNTTVALTPGDYTLISKGTGSVGGTVPGTLNIGGSGIGGNVGSLLINASGLVLHVAAQALVTPVITSTNPPSPSNNIMTLAAIGTATTGDLVTIYDDSACTHAISLGSTAGIGNSFNANPSVPFNTTTNLYAKSTNGAASSACSSPAFPFTHDNIAPAVPAISGSTPPSPNPNTTPTINGTESEVGSTVKIWSGSTCSGTLMGTGTSDGSGHFAIPVSALTAGSSNVFSANATDAATNVSACSAQPYTYIVGSLPSVTAQAATGITTTDATLNGTVTSNGGAPLTERGFYYKAGTGVTTASTKVLVGGTGVSAFSATLNAVFAPGTLYSYIAYATNVAGTTVSSPETTFTTVTPTPTVSLNPSTPMTFLDTAVGSTSASHGSALSGTGLTAGITCSPEDPNFQVSTDDANWFPSVTYAQSGGTASGPLFVRFSPQSAGAKNGNVACTSGTASAVILISGTGTTPPSSMDIGTDHPAGSSMDGQSVTFNSVLTGNTAAIPPGTMVWGASHNITGDTDVSTAGTLISAVSINGPGTATVNGVTFAGMGASGATGPFNLDASGVGGGYGGYGVPAAPFNTLSANYQNLLTNGNFGSGASLMTLTLNSLSVGTTYQFEVWINDSRAFSGTEAVNVASGSSTARMFGDVTATVGGTGQYLIGTFTADSSSKVITFQGDSATLLNALMLRQLPSNAGALVGKTVTFHDGNCATPAISTGTTDSVGATTLTTSTLSVGTHTITACFDGDANNSASNKSLTHTVVAAPPSISSISPAQGTVGGGTSVVISGANFLPVTSVKFGTSSALFVVNDANTITATAPPHAVGAVDITVTAPAGTSTTGPASTYTYVAPPVAVDDSGFATPVDHAFGRGVGRLFTNDTLNGATITAHTSPVNGTLNSFPNDGSFTYTPNNGFSGNDTFTYTLTNGAGSSTATVTIYVDVLPTITSTTPANGAVDINIHAPITINFSEQIDTTNAFLISPPVTFTQSPTDGNATSSFVLTPTSALAPGQTYTVTVVGNQTADLDGGQSMAGNYTFTFTTLPIPALMNDGFSPLITASQDTALDTALLSPARSVLDNDTLNGGSLTVFGPSGPLSNVPVDGTSSAASFKGGTVVLRPNGTFLYTPAAGFSGRDRFFYKGTNSSVDPAQGTPQAQVQISVVPATPTPTNGGPYCEGATIQLNTPTVAGATYSWTGPGGFTSSDQNPTRTGATTAFAGPYSVTVTVDTVSSLPGTTNVVVSPIPATPIASNTGPYVTGDTISLSTPFVTGASYAWTGPNGFASPLQSPTRTGATLADAGTYSVTVTTTGCASAAGSTTVVVNPAPPSITGLNPTQGSVNGGTSVVISGSNFVNVTSVTFGANTASFVLNNANTITATAPAANNTGQVPVTVTTAAGASNNNFLFEYIPAFSMYHATQIEGDSGAKVFRVPVFRNPVNAPPSTTSTVQYTTQNGTATAGSDYVTASGTLTFTPGQVIKYVDITVNGDTTQEPDETFTLHLSNPTNGVIEFNDDVSTIQNDDNPVGFVVTKTADTNDGVCNSDCSLREAVNAANSNIDFNIISFNIPPADAGCPSGTCTITLGSALQLANSVYIDGPGANQLVINGGGGFNRVFETGGLPSYGIGNYRLKGMTIENGHYSGDQGGGIYAISADLYTLDGVIVRNNTSDTAGGGISFWQGNFEILNSTITGNSAFACGGMKVSNGNLTIANSTFSGNTATNDFGGGICAYGNSNVTIRKSTIANNTSPTAGGGIYNYNLSQLNIGNSIVAGNSAATSPDIFNENTVGTITTGGYNLIGKNNGTSAGVFPAGNPNANNDIVGTTASPMNPLLSGLGNNGGTMPTHALGFGSPAIDKGSFVSGLTTDQRGQPRYDNPAIPNAASGDGSDIGAFEVQAVPAPTIGSLNPTSGPTTGSTSVVITGTNFIGVTSVTFGGVAATSFTEDSTTQVTAISPAHGAGPVSVLVNASGGVTAVPATFTFVAPTYTITASSGPNGSISPSGTVTLTEGDSQTFAITPAPGFQVNDVLVDSVSAGAVTSYAFTNVTANHTISASFAAIPPADIEIKDPNNATLTTPALYDFGPVVVNTSSGPRTFTITNTGGTPLSITTPFNPTGANSAEFTVNSAGTSTTLPVGQSTTFTVSFSPSLGGGLGGRVAAIFITSSDPDENPFVINLAGTASSAGIEGTVTYRMNINAPIGATPTPTPLLVTQPVPDVTITSAGSNPNPAPVQTDASGHYSLTGFGAGNYTLTGTHADKACGSTPGLNGIKGNDATQVLRKVVNIVTMSPEQAEAADVSGLGAVNALDATLIARYVVCINTPGSLVGKWRIKPQFTNPINGQGGTYDFNALLMGEVTGDWSPTGASLAERHADPETSARISVPTMTAPAGTFSVPLRIDNLRGSNVDAYQFDIRFDANVIRPADIAADLNATMGQNLTVVSNSPEPGLLKVVVYGVQPANGDGVYANLNFASVGAAGATSPITISDFGYNEGRDPVIVTSGSVTISAASSQATLSGRLTYGEGRGIRGAQVRITDAEGSVVQQVTSGSAGGYRFDGLALGQAYTITVRSRRFVFPPTTVAITDNSVNGVDIQGSLSGRDR